VAFGFSGWHLNLRQDYAILPIDNPGAQLMASAGWALADRLEITVGAVLLVGGGLMRARKA